MPPWLVPACLVAVCVAVLILAYKLARLMDAVRELVDHHADQQRTGQRTIANSLAAGERSVLAALRGRYTEVSPPPWGDEEVL